MQRKKSLLAATIISAVMLTGAVAYAANGVFDGRDDNVGNLQTSIQPTDVTLFIDPATGSLSSTRPAVATAQPVATAPAAAVVTAPTTAAVTPSSTDDDSGHDSDDDKGGDRRYGRDGDDD